jgi:hypothetical protein
MNMNTTIEHNFDRMNVKSLSNVTIWKVVAFLVRISLFAIGTFLSLQIIRVCRKERDKVWLINVTRAVAAISLMIFIVIFEALTEHIPDFSDYTGVGICYLVAFLYVYLPYMIMYETLFVSIIKYVFIVHTAKSRKYGEDKIINRFFWFNILHGLLPAIITVYLWDFEGFTSLTSCFGLQEKIKEEYYNKNSPSNNLERRFMCKLRVTDSEDLRRHFSYMLAQSFCFSKMVFNFIFGTNIPEAYFYYKIFQKMNRYEQSYLLFIISF